MLLADEDQICYLANLVFITSRHGDIPPMALSMLEEIRIALGAKKSSLQHALRRVQSGEYHFVILQDFVANVSNTADLVRMSLIGGNQRADDDRLIRDFALRVFLTVDQFELIREQVTAKKKTREFPMICPSCGTKIVVAATYCPMCGVSLVTVPDQASKDYLIPKEGLAIEFCESNSASFPAALRIAQSAPAFSSNIRNKKTWYLATWSLGGSGEASELARPLTGIRNRKCYVDGHEMQWDDLFAWLYCADGRNKAYRPIEYCFGRDESRINPWGCKQAQLDWTEWAKWFSYGRFEKGGFLDRNGLVWVFDKSRIRHEVMTNLHRVRFCPHLRITLVQAVLDALPDSVPISQNREWTYAHASEDAPGAVKVKETRRSNGLVFNEEYYSDGIRPAGLGGLQRILQKAFAQAGIMDIEPVNLVQ